MPTREERLWTIDPDPDRKGFTLSWDDGRRRHQTKVHFDAHGKLDDIACDCGQGMSCCDEQHRGKALAAITLLTL